MNTFNLNVRTLLMTLALIASTLTFASAPAQAASSSEQREFAKLVHERDTLYLQLHKETQRIGELVKQGKEDSTDVQTGYARIQSLQDKLDTAKSRVESKAIIWGIAIPQLPDPNQKVVSPTQRINREARKELARGRRLVLENFKNDARSILAKIDFSGFHDEPVAAAAPSPNPESNASNTPVEDMEMKPIVVKAE